MQPSSIGPYAWMLMGCAAFTGMYALVYLLRDICDWQLIAFFRTSLACLFAVGLARAVGAQLVYFRPAVLWIRSLAGSFSLLCAFFAYSRHVPMSNVLAITSIFPIWVAILAWPMLGAKPGWSVLLSAFTAVAGVWLICGEKAEGLGEALYSSEDAALVARFALFASVATAVAMLGLNKLYWIDTRAVVAHFSAVSAICSLGAIFLFDTQYPLSALVEPQIALMLLGLGVTATAGQICLTKAFTIGAPAKVSVVALTQIVMMLAVDVAAFGQHFTFRNLLGIVLVMLPTAWVILTHRMRSATAESP